MTALPIFEAAVWFLVPAMIAMLAHWGFHVLFPNEPSDQTLDAAKWGSVRIGAVHALILALAFSSVRSEYNELQESIDNEALAIEQLYRGLQGFGTPEAEEIQMEVERYARMVVDEEWPSMAAGHPLADADLLVDAIYRQIVDLADSTERSSQASALLNDINDIENERGQRSFDIAEPLSPMFWMIAVVGLFLTCVSFFPTPHGLLRSSFLGMFAGMNGLVFFAIIGFSHPFSTAFPIQPTPFVQVLERTIQAEQ